jgi:peptidylprolyl isomerase
MLRLIAVLALLTAPALVAPASAQQLPAGADPANTLLVDTTKGPIVVAAQRHCPQHAARLKQLARDKFYDNVPFHRVIGGFMAQTGDGQNGNGTGGSKYPDLKAEFSPVPFKRGVVGMARKGNSNDSANSQFFIMFGDGAFLNGQYTVIGEVLSGMDVVDKLKKGERRESGPHGHRADVNDTARSGNRCACGACGRLNVAGAGGAVCSVLSEQPCTPFFGGITAGRTAFRYFLSPMRCRY